MRVKKFKEFIGESYLDSGRAPLYHFTSYNNLVKIIQTDSLLISRLTRGSHGNTKGIAVTRNIDFSDTYQGTLIELDYDKLLKDGYKSYPVDEWAWTHSGKPNKDAIAKNNLNKNNFTNFKNGKRGTRHGLELPKDPTLEIEFEERIYKDIHNLGKYIIKIYITTLDSSSTQMELTDYLIKYPNIKVYKTDDYDFRFKSTDITNFIKNTEYDKSKDSTSTVANHSL